MPPHDDVNVCNVDALVDPPLYSVSCDDDPTDHDVNVSSSTESVYIVELPMTRLQVVPGRSCDRDDPLDDIEDTIVPVGAVNAVKPHTPAPPSDAGGLTNVQSADQPVNDDCTLELDDTYHRSVMVPLSATSGIDGAVVVPLKYAMRFAPELYAPS